MKHLCRLGRYPTIMTRSLIVFLTSVLMLFASMPASASPLNREIVFSYPPQGYPPYIVLSEKNPDVQGIIADIFRGIANDLGYQVKFRKYPDRRAQILIKRGKIDALAFAREWSANPENYEWTAPILEVADHLIFDTRRTIKNASIDKLQGKFVGTMVAFSYPSFNEAFDADTIKRVDAPAFDNLFMMLKSGRVDVILLDERVAGWHVAQSPDLHPHDFAITRPGFDPVGYRIMMPRLKPLGWNSFIRKYDEKLEDWHQNGRLKEVINRYGVHLKQARR